MKNKFTLIFGILIGITISIFLFSGHSVEIISKNFEKAIAVYIIFALLFILFFIVIYNKVTEFLNNNSFFDIEKINLEQTFESWDNLQIELINLKKTLEKVIISWTFRSWVFKTIQILILGFIGLFGSILIVKQNKLIDAQNGKISQQIALQEAERRSALVFLFNNTLDKMDDELKEGNSSLTPQLTSRIIALSRALKPYKYLIESDSLIKQPLSPERGQLIINLVQSGIEQKTLLRIFREGDFSNSDLKGAFLNDVKIKQVRLAGGDLSGVSLRNGEIIGGYLYGAKFIATDLTNSDLRATRLHNGDLTGSQLNKADLRAVFFNNVKFGKIDYPTYQALQDGYLYNDNNRIDSMATSFAGADLRKAKFAENDFNGVKLGEAKVNNKFWIDSLIKNKCRGIGYLKKNYYVDTTDVQYSSGGVEYYLIKAKQ